MINKINKKHKDITMADILKDSGYGGEHVCFANMVIELLTTSGKHLGHTVVADLVNVIHFAHLITLYNNDVIKYDSDDPNDKTVMNYSAMFAQNIMATKTKVKLEEIKEND